MCKQVLIVNGPRPRHKLHCHFVVGGPPEVAVQGENERGHAAMLLFLFATDRAPPVRLVQFSTTSSMQWGTESLIQVFCYNMVLQPEISRCKLYLFLNQLELVL